MIGPWDHFGAQGRPSPVIAGYLTDPAARLDITSIIYQWMDYVMKGGAKPPILENRINYQVMGTNAWRHAPTLQAMNDDTLTFYLRNLQSGSRLLLGPRKGTAAEFANLSVDLSDRTIVNDNSIHNPLADSTVDVANGIAFESEPLAEAITINGSLGGTLRATINKRDMDVGVELYERTPAGQYFQLAFYVGRASYAKSKVHRRLLVPGAIEDIPLNNTRMISRKLSKGSRLVVVVNVNKSSSAPINYGTGTNVSDETIADAGEPLQIRWHGSSTIRIPIHR
ncbi:hypothetical protein BH11GEM2_BH11GEM2_14610 [soil metagenome]